MEIITFSTITLSKQMSEPTKPDPVQVAAKIMSSFLGAMIAAGGSIPSGHLYAAVMGHINIDLYDALISKMIEMKYITKSNHLLTITETGRAYESRVEQLTNPKTEG